MEDEQSTSISVTIDANPVASVDWLFNGAPIDSEGEGGNQKKLENESRVLTIPAATMGDAGVYTVVADNGIGQAVQTDVELVVTPKTYPIEVKLPHVEVILIFCEVQQKVP